MKSILNGVSIILVIPFVIILIVAGYYIGEWVLNGFQDLKEEGKKSRNSLQVIVITVFGIIAIYFFLSLFEGCEGSGDIDTHRP